MSLQTRLSDLITSIGTDYKQLRVWVTGSSSGDLTALTTTAKNSVVAAINELKSSLQPLSGNLTDLSSVMAGAFGKTLLTTSDASAAKMSLGLADVASSGSASDLTTGTLAPSLLPPLAIGQPFSVDSEAAMLALDAQRGDVAVRSDVDQNYILSTDDPTQLANWVKLLGSSDVTSVAGRVGAVVVNKTDVGLANVDNTADVDKPVSTAQAAADSLALKKTANLSDLANLATARTNLSVYSQADLGDPTTDLTALYTAAKA